MTLHNPTCFANHLGLWLVEPQRLQHAVGAIRTGAMQPRQVQLPIEIAATVIDGELEKIDDPRGEVGTLYRMTDGVAIVELHGVMMKGWSKYADASSVMLRRAMRAAADDERVREILLVIDSPGGQAAGTQALADDVGAIDSKRKPVHAHIDDLGASAAYWTASQARSISANRTAEVGSIGTVAVVMDQSKQFEMEGIQTHVISTGLYKGAFAQGAPIKPEHLAELQKEVDGLNAFFLDAVTSGRRGRMSKRDVEHAADGRVWLAGEAKEMGLIDEVRSLDDTLAAILRARSSGAGSSSRSRRMRASMVAHEVYALSDIAKMLDKPRHRIEYAIASRGIESVGKAAQTKLYDRGAVNSIRAALRAMDALRSV